MDNGRRNQFPASPWDEYLYSKLFDSPLFFSTTEYGYNQQPGALSMHCTDFHGSNSQGVDHNQRRAQTIVHPGAMPLSASFHTPPHPGNLENPSSQPHEQVSVNAMTQQIPPYDPFSRRVCAMAGGRIICDPGGNQYTDAYSVSPGQRDVQPVSGSMLSSTGYIQSPCIALDGVSNIASKKSAPRRPARDASLRCPICPAPLSRLQDRNRHVSTHLPHWIQCSDPSCSWRGNRWETLRRHRARVHPSSSQESDKQESMIYDPWPLVEGITKGTTQIKDARVSAISMVKKRALKLGKLEIWGDGWAHKIKRKTRKIGSRVALTKFHTHDVTRGEGQLEFLE
ncbi:hypothetical protein BJV74DRAFT_547811 [Russula compacta]|nr:hypothetical protein BJV74DRAFT_547811 [Russula compacta]